MKFDQKFVGGALILVSWGALVILKMAPAAQFIDALQVILGGLGIYHITANKAV